MKQILVLFVFIALAAAGTAQSGTDVRPSIAVTSVVFAKAVIPGIEVNPKPVTNNSFTLELRNLEKGKYSVFLFDDKGKKYVVKTWEFSGGSATEQLQLPAKARQGTYILQVISKTSRHISKMVVE